jgi:spore germination protein YaaH
VLGKLLQGFDRMRKHYGYVSGLLLVVWPISIALAAPAKVSIKSLPEITTLMYLVNRPDSVESFRQHAKQISIIAPQCFSMQAGGFVFGEVPPEVLAIAAQHRVAVMPLVVQRGFDQPLMHTVLDDPAARARAIRYLLYYALRDGYLGMQFDYENIHYSYRDRFTTFFHEAAREFHRHGLLLSIAVVGKYSDERNAESPGGYENWSGVYDYAAIGRVADFVSIMAYPQHAGFSDPGPIAGYPWVQQVVDFTLKQMPARKVSLGVPLYGHRWTAIAPGEVANPASFVQDNEGAKVKRWKTASTGYPAIPDFEKQAPATWDELELSPNITFSENGLANVVWFENAKSLQPKLQLSVDRRLQGISAWVLGREDPAFWTMVQKNFAVRHPRCGLLVSQPLAARSRAAARKLSARQRH